MKQLLVSFTQYEYWANKQILELVLSLSEAQQQQEIKSSFPSIYKTCLHMWDASTIWWQRLHKVEQIVVPSLTSHPTMNDIANSLLQQNKEWTDWVNAAVETDFEYVLPYKNMKGDFFQQAVKEILLHLSNHGTYHRGQLVTMLRQVGVEQIPQTDYILFSRS